MKTIKLFLILISSFIFSGMINYNDNNINSNFLSVTSIIASDRAQFALDKIFNVDGIEGLANLNMDISEIVSQLGEISNIGLKNNSDEAMDLKIKISIFSDQEGEIGYCDYDGPFIINSGEIKYFSSNDFDNSNHGWTVYRSKFEAILPEISNALLSYGDILPERTYTIKIEFFENSSEGPINQNASYGHVLASITQFLTTGQVQLNYPFNNSQLSYSEAQNIIFSWSPLKVRTGVAVVYTFNLYEIKKGQTAQTAQNNTPVYTESLQDQYSLDYSLKSLSSTTALKPNTDYVWLVEARDLTGRKIGKGISDLFVLSIEKVEAVKLISAEGDIYSKEVIFNWLPSKISQRYKLNIYEANSSRLIFSKELENVSSFSSDQIVPALLPNLNYQWEVLVLDEENNILNTSESRRSFSIKLADNIKIEDASSAELAEFFAYLKAELAKIDKGDVIKDKQISEILINGNSKYDGKFLASIINGKTKISKIEVQ